MPDTRTQGAASAVVPGPSSARFRRFSAEPLTSEEREYVRQCVKRSGKRLNIKECFHNAQRTLLLGDTDRRLVYAEGRARGTDGCWIHHGWLTINGKVVDLTLNAASVGLKVFVPKHVRNDARYVPGPVRVPDEYIGEEYDRDEVYDLVKSGVWGSMLSTIEALESECEGVRDA